MPKPAGLLGTPRQGKQLFQRINGRGVLGAEVEAVLQQSRDWNLEQIRRRIDGLKQSRNVLSDIDQTLSLLNGLRSNLSSSVPTPAAPSVPKTTSTTTTTSAAPPSPQPYGTSADVRRNISAQYEARKRAAQRLIRRSSQPHINLSSHHHADPDPKIPGDAAKHSDDGEEESGGRASGEIESPQRPLLLAETLGEDVDGGVRVDRDRMAEALRTSEFHFEPEEVEDILDRVGYPPTSGEKEREGESDLPTVSEVQQRLLEAGVLQPKKNRESSPRTYYLNQRVKGARRQFPRSLFASSALDEEPISSAQNGTNRPMTAKNFESDPDVFHWDPERPDTFRPAHRPAKRTKSTIDDRTRSSAVDARPSTQSSARSVPTRATVLQAAPDVGDKRAQTAANGTQSFRILRFKAAPVSRPARTSTTATPTGTITAGKNCGFGFGRRRSTLPERSGVEEPPRFGRRVQISEGLYSYGRDNGDIIAYRNPSKLPQPSRQMREREMIDSRSGMDGHVLLRESD